MSVTIRAQLLLTLLLIGGCESRGTPQRLLEARTVEIPITRSCTGQVPKGKTEQDYADFNLPLGADAAPERYRLIAKANEQRRERLAVAEPAIEACR